LVAVSIEHPNKFFELGFYQTEVPDNALYTRSQAQQYSPTVDHDQHGCVPEKLTKFDCT